MSLSENSYALDTLYAFSHIPLFERCGNKTVDVRVRESHRCHDPSLSDKRFLIFFLESSNALFHFNRWSLAFLNRGKHFFLQEEIEARFFASIPIPAGFLQGKGAKPFL